MRQRDYFSTLSWEGGALERETIKEGGINTCTVYSVVKMGARKPRPIM